MANTNVKAARTPRQPRQPKVEAPVVEPEVKDVVETPEIAPEETEVQTPTTEVENTPEVLPDPEPTPEPEPEPVKKVAEPKNEARCTEIHLVQKGEKYNVFRGTKRLTRSLVTLDKAKLIALGYGESNPTVL